jgi:hypothetical protein
MEPVLALILKGPKAVALQNRSYLGSTFWFLTSSAQEKRVLDGKGEHKSLEQIPSERLHFMVHKRKIHKSTVMPKRGRGH